MDALVGVRGSYARTPQFHVVGWGLVGAGEADVDWDVAAGVGHASTTLSRRRSATALGVDHSKDSLLFDAVQQGPIAGLTTRF